MPEVAEVCGAEYPENAEITCQKVKPCYVVHIGSGEVWPAPDAPPEPKRRSGRQIIDTIGAGIKPEASAGPPGDALKEPKKFVRDSDPTTAHEAYERYEPEQGTRKSNVLNYLRDREGQWVDAPELTTIEVGGFAGTRRLRELREDGWAIETRPKPGATNTWQHRLAPVAQQA